MFVTVNPLTPLLAGRPSLTRPANMKLGWKWMTVKNTLAYYGSELNLDVLGFVAQANGVNV